MAAGAPIILFEDNHILAVNKRPSDIVQSDKTGDETLADRARDYLREKYGKPGNVFIGIPDERRGHIRADRKGAAAHERAFP